MLSDSELQEILASLSSSDRQVKEQAAHILFIWSGSGEASSVAESVQTSLVQSLVAQFNGKSPQVRLLALQASTNFAQEEERFIEVFVEAGAVALVVELLCGPAAHYLLEAAASLLVNLSSAVSGAEAIVAESRWPELLEQIIKSDGTPDVLATILPNIARSPSGRAALLHSEFLKGLTAALATTNVLSFFQAFRNILLAAKEDANEALIADQSEVFQAVLKLLCEAKDPRLRATLAETILLAAVTEPGLTTLWAIGAPAKLQKVYELEEDEAVCQALEATAEIFLSHNEDHAPVDA